MTGSQGVARTGGAEAKGRQQPRNPNHRYIAATDGNSEAAWADEVDIKNLNVIGLLRNAPLLIVSPNTNIAAAYQAEGGDVGATVGAYQDADATFEIWLRPSTLTAAQRPSAIQWPATLTSRHALIYCLLVLTY